jgi:hypothetical protein
MNPTTAEDRSRIDQKTEAEEGRRRMKSQDK